MATIYRKTVKGQHEVETRALKLAPKFRSLLILIDGKRSDEELRRMLPQADDNALEALAAGGFVEAIAVTADPRPAPRSAPPPAEAPAPAPAVQNLPQRRREAVRVLNELLGPLAEVPAMRLEASRTPEEFRAAMDSAVRFVGNVRGPLAAADYAQRFLEI